MCWKWRGAIVRMTCNDLQLLLLNYWLNEGATGWWLSLFFGPLPLVLIPFIRDSWDSKLPQVTINYFEVRCTHFMALLYIHLPRCKWEVKVNFGEFPTKNII